MRTGLRTRLIAAFSLVSLVSVLALGVSANLFFDAQFTSFVQARIAADEQQTVQTLSDSFAAQSAWDENQLSVLGMNALGRGYIIRIQDDEEKLVWDARTHNDGMCQQMLATMARNMALHFASWNGGYQEAAFPVRVGEKTVGTAWIGYYGPFYFNDSELYFLDSINRIILVSALISLAIAVGLGILMAGWISRPLRQVTLAAHDLGAGSLETRITQHSNIREIGDLSLSINQLAQSLSEQESLRRRLMSDVSHELRTPLTAILGNVEGMIDGVIPHSNERLESCRDEILRLTRLVKQIEELARAESLQSRYTMEDVDLGRLVEQVCTTFQAEAARRDIALTWKSEELVMRAVPDALSQALTNLVSNALKYSEAGGAVHVDAYQRPAGDKGTQSVVISVEDHGPGIPAEDLPHIFERFYRVDASRTRATGGAGIGLTIAKSMVQLHGGSISVKSSPGEGSVFEIVVPWGE